MLLTDHFHDPALALYPCNGRQTGPCTSLFHLCLLLSSFVTAQDLSTTLSVLLSTNAASTTAQASTQAVSTSTIATTTTDAAVALQLTMLRSHHARPFWLQYNADRHCFAGAHLILRSIDRQRHCLRLPRGVRRFRRFPGIVNGQRDYRNRVTPLPFFVINTRSRM